MWEFIETREWRIFINIARFLTFVGIAIILYVFIKEIEAVKLLAYDPCRICISKTGCQCFCLHP